MDDDSKSLLQLKEEFPSYNLRVFAGGIYITARWDDLDEYDLKKFRGRAYVDHSCNEIDLSNKE